MFNNIPREIKEQMRRLEMIDARDRAESDFRVDSVIVPIGKGVLVCRKI